MNPPVVSATKHRKGSKFVVKIVADGEILAIAGGARAERANAVIVFVSATDGSRRVLGLRADVMAADAEAGRLTRPQIIRARGRRSGPGTEFPAAASWASAIRIEDAE